MKTRVRTLIMLKEQLERIKSSLDNAEIHPNEAQRLINSIEEENEKYILEKFKENNQKAIL